MISSILRKWTKPTPNKSAGSELLALEFTSPDAQRSVDFYSKLLGIQFTKHSYCRTSHHAVIGRQRLIISQSQAVPHTSTPMKLQFELPTADVHAFVDYLATHLNITATSSNLGGFDFDGQRFLDRWVVSVRDPDGNELEFRTSLSGRPKTLREKALKGWVVGMVWKKKLFDRARDAIDYTLNIAPVRNRNLSGYTHLVASREGLYAASTNGFSKLLRGQFYGMSILNGDVFCFQANGHVRSPQKRGRIVKLCIKHGGRETSISRARVVTKGLHNGCHQMDFIGDQLYVVDTYNDQVIRLDSSFNVSATFNPLGGVDDNSRRGESHMNSLVYFANSFWLLLHNGPKYTNSELLRLNVDFEVQARQRLDAQAAHNIVFLEDGRVLVCDSGGGNLIDAAGVVKYIGAKMLRGLSIDETILVIGDSYYSAPPDRRYVPGQVHFYDRQLRHLVTLTLPAAPTEIRRIDGKDLSLSNFRNALDSPGPAKLKSWPPRWSEGRQTAAAHAPTTYYRG
jgi:catechol 2,3-dioxygenase-like lactoylglutathione lyase family enzyme